MATKKHGRKLPAAGNMFVMPYGHKRRAVLLELLREGYPDGTTVWSQQGWSGLVNRHHRPILKHDPDLQKLLKSGKVRRVRKGTPKCRYTYLIPND